MGSARAELDAEIVALLEAQDRPIQETARELSWSEKDSFQAAGWEKSCICRVRTSFV